MECDVQPHSVFFLAVQRKKGGKRLLFCPLAGSIVFEIGHLCISSGIGGKCDFFGSQFVEKSDDEVRFVGHFPDSLALVLHAAAAAAGGGGMLQANGEGRRAST